jgi:hypothetical protein
MKSRKYLKFPLSQISSIWRINQMNNTELTKFSFIVKNMNQLLVVSFYNNTDNDL